MSSSETFFEARLASLWTATLRPAYEVAGSEAGAVALLLAALIGAVTVVRTRGRGGEGLLIGGLTIAFVLVVARTTVLRHEPDLVPGALAASPLIFWGLFGLRRDLVRRPPCSILAVAGTVFFGAVILTQYSIGGAWEFGARYLEAGLPLFVPLAVVGVATILEALPPRGARRATGLLVAIALVITGSGLLAQRDARHRVANQIDESLATAATTDSGIIISTFPSLPRSAIDQFDKSQRWLWTWPDGLPALLSTLDEAGIKDAVLVSHDEDRSDRYLDETGWTRGPSDTLPANPGQWHISTVSNEEVDER